MNDPILEDERFAQSLAEVMRQLGVSQKELIESGFERQVSTNTISLVLSRKQQASALLATEMLRALANVKGIDQLISILLTPPNEAHKAAFEFIYSCLISAYIDNISASGIKKKHLDKYIEDKFRDAEREIVFIGSVPSRYLDDDFYQLIADVISKESAPKVEFFIEAPQNLFWRSFSLDSKRENEARPYQMMWRKHETIKSIMATQVPILSKNQSDARELFSIFECDFSLYTDAIKIDDEIFFSHRTSYRQSESVIYRVRNPLEHTKNPQNDHLWGQMMDYVSFLQKSAKSPSMVGPILEERDKISVYSDGGRYQRGAVRRVARREFPELETNVVHGLIFDRKGRVCLQYRRSPESGEDALLWDKSFGALRRPGELSLQDTLVGAFSREILDDVTTRMAESRNTSYKTKDIQFLGSWRGVTNIKDMCPADEWSVFSYEDDERNKIWRFPKDTVFFDEASSGRETVLFPNTFASIFILICDDAFARLVDETQGDSDNPENAMCRWYDVLNQTEISPTLMTRDLAAYLDSGGEHGYRFSRKLRRIRSQIIDDMKGKKNG